jgi:hypothetical protein
VWRGEDSFELVGGCETASERSPLTGSDLRFLSLSLMVPNILGDGLREERVDMVV